MGSKRSVDYEKESNQHGKETDNLQKASVRKPSLRTLITWNITKALENNPRIDLRVSLREAQNRLEHDVGALTSTDARYLCCAMLAWQQLGHHGADSLFSFIEKNHTISFESDNPEIPEYPVIPGRVPFSPNIAGPKDISCKSKCQWDSSTKMDFSASIGLVVKLPEEPQTVMHFSGPVKPPHKLNKCGNHCKLRARDTTKKIEAACCLDEACMQKLSNMEAENMELRKRAALIARREAERAELLERAEMAWRDLDSSYQRRLRHAMEKEQDLEKQAANYLDERNSYKAACIPLAAALSAKAEMVEKEREQLTLLEQSVCAKTCTRLGLLKNDAAVLSLLTEHQCKVVQHDRDLALKEEQEVHKRRKLANEVEAAQMLVHEAEYAQRAELSALRRQVQQAAQELLEEDARTTLLGQRVADYMQEKDEMIEDLETCQKNCDRRMEGLVNDSKKLKQQMEDLEKKVMECLCKEPVNKTVEVKRTASLVALCKCSSNELIEGCSCVSLRTRLLSSLLRDLFGGLKTEMEDIGSRMPCDLLKCLEDKHNWDRASDIKKNIGAYFSQLLLGELDIAIAAVIEKGHAQWVGESCADRTAPAARDSGHSLRWQEHEVEMKAQKMATKIAEKMFQDKATELAKRAEDMLTKDGRPPCECCLYDDTATQDQYSSVYRCLVQPHPVGNLNKNKNGLTIASVNDHRRDRAVNQRMPINHVKKNVHGITMPLLHTLQPANKNRKKDVKNRSPERMSKNNNGGFKSASPGISSCKGRKPDKTVINKDDTNKGGVNFPKKVLKEPQQYAVNMCLCDKNEHFSTDQLHSYWNLDLQQFEANPSCYHKVLPCISSLKTSKPVLSFSPEISTFDANNAANLSSCTEKCSCFHKLPSNTSVDRLIDILTKWKNCLDEPPENCLNSALNTDLFKLTHTSKGNVLLQQLPGEVETKKSIRNVEQFSISDKNIKHDSQKNNELEGLNYTRSIAYGQIPNNQSQYMGAVNLDRSKDLLYKSDENEEEKIVSLLCDPEVKSVSADTEVKLVENQKNPCESKVYRHNYVDGNSLDNKSTGIQYSLPLCKDYENCIQCLGVTLTKVSSKILSSKDTKHKNQSNDKLNNQQKIYHNNEKSKDKRTRTQNKDKNNNEIGDGAKFPAQVSKKCENIINFLGATLDNTNTKTLAKQYSKLQINQNGPESYTQNGHSGQKIKFQHEKPLTSNADPFETRSVVNRIKTVGVISRLDERTNNSKSDNILSNESCICCPTLDADNSNDLEVNTFQLLGEHLKCQLEEFKHSVCKSSCMQNVDEKNLVNDTLLRVKKIILESASTVTCNNKYSGGSWNRAYSLLQEYLKTKIERISGLCNAPGNNSHDHDNNVVPRVLGKISCLIENDLQRLKDICKCKNMIMLNKPEFEMFNTRKYKNIDDINDCENFAITNTVEQKFASTSKRVESVFANYTNPNSLLYNKSAQVLLHNSVVTKSCDALKTYSKYSEVQTVDMLKNEVIVDDCIIRNSVNDCRSISTTTSDDSMNGGQKKSNQVSYIQGEFPTKAAFYEKTKLTVIPPISLSSVDNNKEKCSTETEQLFDKQLNDEQNQGKSDDFGSVSNIGDPILPYIGYTINCSCDSDLGCACTKSTVLTNTDLLKSSKIWNAFTRKQRELKNVSYLLNKLSSPLLEEKNVNVTGDVSTIEIIKLKNPTQCESEICINDDKNIYQKGSKKVNVVNDSYNTEMVQANKPNYCESEVSANEEKNVYLKKSHQRLNIVHGSTNTLKVVNSLQCISMPHEYRRYGILKQNIKEFPHQTSKHVDYIDASKTTDNTTQESDSSCTDCDCAMVPVCHVKMLMDSIGNKLGS